MSKTTMKETIRNFILNCKSQSFLLKDLLELLYIEKFICYEKTGKLYTKSVAHQLYKFKKEGLIDYTQLAKINIINQTKINKHEK